MNCGCGRPIVQPKTGRRRKKCETCSPTVPRPERNAPVVSIASAKPQSGTSKRSTVAESTLADLERSGQDSTTQGLVALHLADLLDSGDYTAQGAAALVKAHREALDLALAAGQSDADVIDLIFGESS